MLAYSLGSHTNKTLKLSTPRVEPTKPYTTLNPKPSTALTREALHFPKPGPRVRNPGKRHLQSPHGFWPETFTGIPIHPIKGSLLEDHPYNYSSPNEIYKMLIPVRPP